MLKRQYAILVFLLPLIFKIAMLPSMLAKETQNDVWIAIFIMLISGLVQLGIIVAIDNLGGLHELEIRYGTIIKKLISAPLLFVLVIKTIVFTAETVNYVTSFLFYNIQGYGVTIVTFLASGYLAIKGTKSIGRIAELLIICIPGVILFGFVFGEISLNFEYVLPVCANGTGAILKGIWKYIFWTCDFTPLLFVKIEKKDKKPLILGFAMGEILMITAIYVIFIAYYGYSAPYIKYAFARMATFNTVHTEIGSVDWPVSTIWMALSILVTALNLHAMGEIICYKKLKKEYSVAIVSIIICFVMIFVVYNFQRAINIAVGIIGKIVAVIEMIMPIIIFIILKFVKVITLKKKNLLPSVRLAEEVNE